MMRNIAIMVLAAIASPVLAADAKPDAPFRMTCASDSTQMLPKGNAGAGKIDFMIDVDPAAQRVTVNGEKHKAKIDAYEVAFDGENDATISISRSMKTFAVIVPIKGLPANDSRKYLYYRGQCK